MSPRPPVDPLRRRAVARLKITHSLLDPTHPKGGPKARSFSAFGFDRAAPDILAHALLDHVVTVWIVRHIGAAEFVTAYPA